ncbi:O-methylsterigmatocystin oxidoreductase [Trametes pubescens]|uniref:O-methylsterigmatocystin oxidoreductase n=1 Tax=Trametes pubescens TaxID=154538 RepID=A0A1M2VCC2_TRAPU|nr:O-methylsterigmatocystin oxidoreductase [Trametes pubescens]
MSPSVPSIFGWIALERNTVALYLAALTAVVLALRGIWFRTASKIPLPPGPRGLPLLGNLFDIPRQSAWQTFAAWSKDYGDVVRLRILGRSIILLNSAEATSDLLEDRFGIYSDRPDFPLMNMVGHDKWNFGFMPYGKKWRALRRLFSSKHASPAALHIFYDSQRAAMGRLLQNLLRDPEGFSEHLRLRSGQLIIDVTYGIMIESVEDPLLKTAEAVMDVTSVALSPPMWLINPSAIMQFIPKWLGGSAVSLRLQRWRQDVENLRNVAFHTCKERFSKGVAKPSYTASLLQELAPEGGSSEEDMIRDTAAVAYGGIPHLLREDDVYRGYHLPKGSIVMGNVWGITHDPAKYPNPSAFKPERYLAADGSFDCSTNDPSRYVFGFGRRVCPGRFLAEDLTWLTVAQFLAVMNVTIPAGGAQPKAEFLSGALSYVCVQKLCAID